MTDIFIGQAPEQDGSQEMNASAETLVYKVKLDSFEKGQDVACTVAGIPAGFSLHPTIPNCRLRKKTAKRQKNSCVWFVTCEYSTPDNNSGENNQENDNPLLDMAEIKVSYEERTVPIRGSLNSTRVYTGGIKNSAGEVFIPPPQSTVPTAVWEIKKNYVDSFDVLTNILSYMDCINSDTFAAAGPHQAYIVSIIPKNDKRNDINFLTLNFIIKFRPTWDLELLDTGSYYLSGSGKVDFLSDKGHPKQGLLDGSGRALASGSADVFLPAIQHKTAKAFAALDLFGTGYKFV